MEMCKVGVIILNWNGAKLLQEFLPSVIAHTDPSLGKIIVADNASSDRSIEILEKEFPGVELMRFDQNYGFAGGYNRAIAAVDAEYAVLLNSDVGVSSGWLEPLVAMLDKDSGIAAVQPKIRAYRDKSRFEYAGASGGFIDWLGFPFCRGRILDEVEDDHGQYDNITDVFWCSGAALFIRKSVYMRAGGLDEKFFAHMEEIDLCWRIRNLGYSLKVNPESVVYHLGGGSLPMNHPKKLYLNYRNNLLMLYKNLDKNNFRKVLTLRFCLDFAAMTIFLLKGETANVKSVINAYRAYGKMKREYTRQGKKNSPVNKMSWQKDGMYCRSIVFDYYFRGKKRFSML